MFDVVETHGGKDVFFGPFTSRKEAFDWGRKNCICVMTGRALRFDVKPVDEQ